MTYAFFSQVTFIYSICMFFLVTRPLFSIPHTQAHALFCEYHFMYIHPLYIHTQNNMRFIYINIYIFFFGSARFFNIHLYTCILNLISHTHTMACAFSGFAPVACWIREEYTPILNLNLNTDTHTHAHTHTQFWKKYHSKYIYCADSTFIYIQLIFIPSPCFHFWRLVFWLLTAFF